MKINVHVAVLSFTWTFSLVCATGSPRPSDADQKKVHVFLALKIMIMNSKPKPAKQMKTLFYAICMVLVSFSFQSCSNKTAKWEKGFTFQLDKAINDGVVTESEYMVLKRFIDAAPENKINFLGHTFNKDNPDALADFLVKEKGVTGDASAIKNRIIRNAPFSKLNIMLENSASMIGYTSAGNPLFTAPVISLFNCIDDSTEVVTGYVHAKGTDDCEFQVVDANDFQKNLANGKIQTATSSPIDQILELIAESANDSTVTALVTDGIVSGTNQEILSTLPARDWTIKNLPLIEQRIRNAAKILHDKGEHFVIYRFETDFKGDYYNYRNLKQNFGANIARPYFIILSGSEKNLKMVRTKLLREDKFNATNTLCSYELKEISGVTSGFISYVPVAGVAKPKMDILPAKSSIKFKKPIPYPLAFKCRVVFNQEIPERCKSVDFLSHNIKLGYKDILSGAYVDKTDIVYDVQQPTDVPGAFDVFIQLTPEFVNTISKCRTLRLYLPLTADSWYRELSISDDSVASWDTSKTFHLDILVEGFIKGFNLDNEDKNLIDININLFK